MSGLELKNVCYHYPKTKHMTLNGVNGVFHKGTVTSIQGQSGAGKSTLLYLLAGLEAPASGQLLWEGEPVVNLSAYRRNVAGIISQSYLLFPARTALENVCYPLTLAKKSKAEAAEEARELINAVGIAPELYNRLPEKMSGGEQQRVAIARCLAAHSQIIAADEPTGNLDEINTRAIVDILCRLAYEEGKTVIMVTHDSSVAERADVRYELRGGELL